MDRPYFDGATYDGELDEERLSSLLERVHERMTDGHWHTLADLARACGGSEASVSARLRDLRKPRFGLHDITRRRVHEGLFEYRMASSRPIGNVGLEWSVVDRYAHASVPEGFTVARVAVPVPKPDDGKRYAVTAMYQAWDARERPAAQLGIFPTREAAEAAAESKYLEGITP